jgi:hypothetical protein
MDGAVTSNEFKAARLSLGLSVVQMADMLGMHPIQIRRMEASPSVASHRKVTPSTLRLLNALLAGYRPK